MGSVMIFFWLATLVCLGHQVFCEQVPAFTPKNKLCWVIKENAVRTLGSDCFNTKASTYRGRGKLKKREFVNYIFQAMGKSEQFQEDMFWTAIRNVRVGPTGPVPSLVNWVPVNGPAMIGDLVLESKKIHIVVSVGVRPVLVNQGRLIFSRSVPRPFFNEMRSQAVTVGWADCSQSPGVADMLIDPSSPAAPCPAWTPNQAQIDQTTGFVAKWKLLRINRRRGPVVSRLVKGHQIVYRYVEAPTSCTAFPNEGFPRVSASLELPSCPGVAFTSTTTVRDPVGTPLGTPPLNAAFTFPPGMNGDHKLFILVRGFNDDGTWMWAGTNDGLVQQLILNAGFTDVNYVIVDWSGGTYEQALANLPVMAFSLVKIMNKFVRDFSSTYNKITCVGMGIGAHYCGEAGKLVGSIGRVTGLNPTPTTLLEDMGLSTRSANYVDVIHSETTTYGTEEPLGHDDYYPHKGVDQPACASGTPDENLLCSHTTSAKYWYANLNTLGNDCLISDRCTDVEDLETTCGGTTGPLMGVTNTGAVGGYWNVAVSADAGSWYCPAT